MKMNKSVAVRKCNDAVAAESRQQSWRRKAEKFTGEIFYKELIKT